MTGAFAYLIVRSTINLARTRLRRLRQPRYAIATLFGLAYFISIFGGGAGRTFASLGATREAIETAGTLLIFLFLALMWLWPGKNAPALGFTPAEVQHLFPAPISRRQLIGYRIARTHIGGLMGALLFTLLSGPGGVTGFVTTFVGIWLLFGAFGLHGMGVSLSREHLGHTGWMGVVRRWVPAAIIVAVAGIIGATLAAHWPRLLALPDTSSRIREAGQILSTGAAGIALWPIRALMRVPAAVGWTAFLRVLPAGVLVWAANAIWVVRSDAAFEEASAEQSEKIAKILQGKTAVVVPSKKRRPPFVLAPIGRAETALLWKNLISVGRRSRASMIVGAIGLGTAVIVILAIDDSGDLVTTVGAICMMLATMVTLTGPLQSRSDLRQDLAHLATLKSWPVRGAVLVRGEVLASAVLLSVSVWLLLTASAALGGSWWAEAAHGSPATLVDWTAAAMLVSSGVIAMELVAHNGIAVLFPAWIRTGPKAAGSIDGMGQQMLMMFGSLLMAPIVALPALVAGAVAWLALQWTLGFVPVLIPAAIVTAVLLVECHFAIEAIGRVLDRTDVSAVDPA